MIASMVTAFWTRMSTMITVILSTTLTVSMWMSSVQKIVCS
uniref:Uncharacterized protein n=1 Tax=Arundo donax TaxID=35708 RepID=A0A0A8ZFT4_ARUDO